MYQPQLYIDLSRLETKFPEEILEILSCQICLGLAIEPCECSGCENVFCSRQIDAMKDKVCPICKASKFRSFDTLHKTYKTIFRILQLKCETCSNTIAYKQYLSHIGKCNNVSEPKIEAQPEPFYNYFFLADEQTIQYDPLNIVSMNVNLREGIDKFRLGPYAIDLKKLEQANTKSGYKRKIVQQKDINHVEQAYWLVKRTENPNDLYEYELQTAIETSYELWIESKKDAKNEEFVFSIEDNNYSINFSLMTQTNLESKFSRTVRRIVI